MLIFTACEKPVEESEQCNCGTILNDNVDNDSYSVDIKNDCTGNVKTFYLTEGDWMSAYVGENYCITNVTSW